MKKRLGYPEEEGVFRDLGQALALAAVGGAGVFAVRHAGCSGRLGARLARRGAEAGGGCRRGRDPLCCERNFVFVSFGADGLQIEQPERKYLPLHKKTNHHQPCLQPDDLFVSLYLQKLSVQPSERQHLPLFQNVHHHEGRYRPDVLFVFFYLWDLSVQPSEWKYLSLLEDAHRYEGC